MASSSRGPWNALHCAVRHGSVERTVAPISNGSIYIDQGTPDGCTPLIIAAATGHSVIVRILLNRGVDSSIASDGGVTALHAAVEIGQLEVL